MEQGIDCSDYSSWLYNYALGVYLDANTVVQGGLDYSAARVPALLIRKQPPVAGE